MGIKTLNGPPRSRQKSGPDNKGRLKMEPLATERRASAWGWAKRVAPVMVSAGILYHYFRDQDWRALMDAVEQARLWMALSAALIPQLVIWFANSLLTSFVMTWYHGPFPMRKYFWVRGALFILQMINNPLAAGGSMLYIRRRTGVGWSRLLGIAAFRLQLALWGFSLFMIPATLAMHYYGMDGGVKMNMAGWWGFLIFEFVFLAVSWVFWFHGTDLTGLGRLLVRDRESEFWTAFNTARRLHWFLVWSVILPQIFIAMAAYYFMARAFGINIPFWESLVVMPVVLAISNLPIAFGGFGTTTLAWVAFFGHYGQPENIAALSLFIPSARAVIRSLIGLVSLTPAVREIASLPLAPGAGEPGPAAGGEEETR